MHLNKLKPAWQQYKWAQGQLPISEQEVMALLDTPKVHRTRSITINLLMLLTLLLVCY